MKTGNVYRWKEGSRYGADPDIVGNTLERLERKYGAATPEKLVAEAKRSKTIYDLFEWDDTKAAHKFRLTQARQVIQSITVVVEQDNGAPLELRAFEVVHRGEGEYRSIKAIMADPDDAEAMKAQALRDLQAWQRRYRNLTAFEAIRHVNQAVLELSGN